MSTELSLFLVRNRDLKWFRAKGYGGYGQTWVEDINKARIYTSYGHAKRTVNFFAKKYPTYGVPLIIEFKGAYVRSFDETENIQKAIEKKNKKKNEVRQKLPEAQKQYYAAKAEYERLQRAANEI